MAEKSPDEQALSRVTFHYLKAGEFRTVHVDGAIGSMTASGQIHCAVYSERPAIPRVVSQAVDETGVLVDGDEQTIESKSGFVRELQADLVLSPEVAIALSRWLAKMAGGDVHSVSEGETIQ